MESGDGVTINDSKQNDSVPVTLDKSLLAYMEGWIVLYPCMIMSASTESGEKPACWWVQLILALLKLGKHVSTNDVKGVFLPRDLLLFGRSSSLQKKSNWIESYDPPQNIAVSTTRLISIRTFEQIITSVILACLTSNMAKHSRSQSSC